MDKPAIITIDGPAGSGKSTIAAQIAKELSYLYFDTGVMYRAVTLSVLNHAVNLDDEVLVTQIAETAHIDVQSSSKDDGRQYDVFLDGVDVTWEIRTREVEALVSKISAYSGVRNAMTAQQRRIGLRGNVVMVGRDIGTVVLPEAPLKIYLDASVEERARRRYNELISRGETVDFDEILSGMRKRDLIDTNRKVAPLKPATDAKVINSDGLSVAEVLEEIKKYL